MSSFTPLSARVSFRPSDLQVHCYTAPTSQQATGYRDYGQVAEQLIFSSAAPGGYLECSFRVYLPPASMTSIPPELDMFSRVVIARGTDARWIGEIDDCERWLQNNQEFIQVHCLGMGNALRDDAESWTYINQTLQQIARDQINQRMGPVSGALAFPNSLVNVIDADVTQLFPDNPAGTWSPSYSEKTIEEVFQDISTFGATSIGTINNLYVWGTEAHPTNKDSRGFPTVRAYIRLRDSTTTHYQASIATGEIDQYNFGHNAQYAYNQIAIDYNNGVFGTGNLWTGDARLNISNSVVPIQGKAPFRHRKLTRDYTGLTAMNGGANVGAVELAYLVQYANPTNKGSVRLRAVRDANGNPLALDAILAGKNILIPDLAVAPTSRTSHTPVFPSLINVAVPGLNQFYIVSCQWQEDNTGPFVTLQLDNFVDRAQNLIAKLMLSSDVVARSTALGNVAFGPGIPDTVTGGGTTLASAGAQTVSWAFSWHAQMAKAPTSTTTSTVSLVNGGGTFVNNLSVYGGNIGCASTAAGAVTYIAQITSVGNTLLAVDEAASTIDWHCGGCDRAHTALAIVDSVQVHPGYGELKGQPGESALKVTCPDPDCGFEEHFNTDLDASHEDAVRHGMHHAEQARLIRQLMAHPTIGLAVRQAVGLIKDGRREYQGR